MVQSVPFHFFPDFLMPPQSHDKPATATSTESNKPVRVFRYRNISASIFANASSNGGTFHAVVLQRTYKDEDEYKHTSSFTRDEIPIARQLLDQAWNFLLEQDAK